MHAPAEDMHHMAASPGGHTVHHGGHHQQGAFVAAQACLCLQGQAQPCHALPEHVQLLREEQVLGTPYLL